MSVLREDLLTGSTIALAGGLREDVQHALISHGGSVEVLDPDCALDEECARHWARARVPLHGLVHDGATAFGHGGQAGLLAALQDAWVAVAAVANGALIPGESGGKVVLLAPRADAGPHAQAARDGLENLARTLSVEWARYGITATAIAPGTSTPDSDIAQLVTFVLSPAGDYFSGCRFALG